MERHSAKSAPEMTFSTAEITAEIAVEITAEIFLCSCGVVRADAGTFLETIERVSLAMMKV